jgi:hypothetical protein
VSADLGRVYDWQHFNVIHAAAVELAPDNDTPLLELVADAFDGDEVTVALDARGVRSLRLLLQRWERAHS